MTLARRILTVAILALPLPLPAWAGNGAGPVNDTANAALHTGFIRSHI
jgi:hypothetical protein